MDRSPDDPVAFCLAQIGVGQPTWKTLVTTAAATTDQPAARLWALWSQLPRWPEWSTPLHSAARWISGESFTPGAQFNQVIHLGFPLGRTSSHETVRTVEPQRRVAWSKEENGVRSCHLWQFEPLPDGGTRISNTEVFHGIPIALVKPLVATRWNRLFQTSVDNLIKTAA
jgi:uncharacterized membrane protein